MTEEEYDAIERGKARAATMSASVGGGRGNFTKERHERPEPSFEELTARMVGVIG